MAGCLNENVPIYTTSFKEVSVESGSVTIKKQLPGKKHLFLQCYHNMSSKIHINLMNWACSTKPPEENSPCGGDKYCGGKQRKVRLAGMAAANATAEKMLTFITRNQ